MDTRRTLRVPTRDRTLADFRVRLATLLSLAAVVVATGVLAPRPGSLRAEDAAPTGRSAPTFMDNVKAGGMIGHTIILCSIIGVSLSLTYAFQIRRDAMVPPELLGELETLFEEENYEEALHVCEANPCFLSSVVGSGLAKLDEGWPEIQGSMQEEGEKETAKLHQKISYISLIAAVGPMLGLFGTVSGMISTFNVIASSDVQPKPADLAGGISEALVTTYEGLVVAIPMTVIYAVFRNRIANVVVEVGEIVEELMGRFKTPSASA
jgi:biopolymer transport protein ExbB